MKRLSLSLIAAVFAAGLSAMSAPASAQQRLRIAGNFALDHSSTLAIEQFKKDVEAATKGALIIETFPNMQLGGAQENVSQTRAGTIAMTWVGMAFLSRTVPELEAVSLPFMFPNREVAYKVMDGPMGDLINQKLADKGFIAPGYMELGPRQVTNNVRPIKTVADMKGMTIRLQPNETHLATFKALGANAVSMDIKEVYSALQKIFLDGEENPYNLILASRFFEVQKYLSNTAHFFDFIAVVANKKVIDSLSPEFRAAIKTAMTKAVAMQRSVAAKNDAEALAELQKKGMQYDVLPPAEHAKMRQMISGVVDEVKKRIGADLVDRALAEVKKAGG